MKTKTSIKKKVKAINSQHKYSDKLVKEVKEAVKDYKDGKYFKGTADDVIKNLRDEATRSD